MVILSGFWTIASKFKSNDYPQDEMTFDRSLFVIFNLMCQKGDEMNYEIVILEV